MDTSDHLDIGQGAAPAPAWLMVDWGSGDDVPVERRSDGRWVYKDSDIPVPGAEDWTVGDAINVRRVARDGEPAEFVLVSDEEVKEHPALDWVLSLGRRLSASDDGVDEFLVPTALWEERSVTPVGVRAPERDGPPLIRRMAIVERELRFARAEVERHTEMRTRMVLIGAAVGMTRRETGESTGLSAGRVQQVLDDASPVLRADVERFLADAIKILRSVGARTVERADLELPDGVDGATLDELVMCGFLQEQDGRLAMSPAGESAELQLRARERKAAGNGSG